jgi:hypothetical protein
MPSGRGRQAIRTLTTNGAKHALASYGDYLATNAPLTDEVILRGWQPLLGNSDAETHPSANSSSSDRQ